MTLNETKKRISIFADQLIHTKGYHGFSYKDIAEEIGIKKASVHHHFASKEELVSSVVEHHIQRFNKWADFHKEKSPTELLLEFKEMYRYLSHNCTRICPVGMLTAEYPILPERVQKQVDKIWNTIHTWVLNVLKEGQNQQVFYKFDPIVKSKLIVLCFQGLLKPYGYLKI